MAVDGRVYLASGSSGKGPRCIRASRWCFYHHEIAPEPERLPRYSTSAHGQQQGVPFTFSSNLFHAARAIKHVDWERRYADTTELSGMLRAKLTELGFELAAPDPDVSGGSRSRCRRKLRQGRRPGPGSGYLLSYNSEYCGAKTDPDLFDGRMHEGKCVSLERAATGLFPPDARTENGHRLSTPASERPSSRSSSANWLGPATCSRRSPRRFSGSPSAAPPGRSAPNDIPRRNT